MPDIQKTAELMQEISAASKKQDAGAEQINRSIQQLDGVSQQNASAAEAFASTAEQLTGQASELEKMIDFFVMDANSNERSERKTETVKTPTGITHIPAPETKSFSQHVRDSKEDSLDNEFETF